MKLDFIACSSTQMFYLINGELSAIDTTDGFMFPELEEVVDFSEAEALRDQLYENHVLDLWPETEALPF